jgi:hypothetical protein
MAPEKSATPENIETFVAAARQYVKRSVGVELDGSDTSLAFVDHYLAATRGSEPVKDDVVALVAPALGAYLGEVAIARFGGRWVLESDAPATWRVELEPVDLRFYPVGMAAEALRLDEVEGYDAVFATRPGLMDALEQALAAAPPVSEEYYYSLTGRLETLEHVVEILVELERQRREEAN